MLNFKGMDSKGRRLCANFRRKAANSASVISTKRPRSANVASMSATLSGTMARENTGWLCARISPWRSKIKPRDGGRGANCTLLSLEWARCSPRWNPINQIIRATRRANSATMSTNTTRLRVANATRSASVSFQRTSKAPRMLV